MSSLRIPGLGPIVGHTSDQSCRLWIRAGDPEDQGSRLAENRRTIGLITITEKNGKEIKSPIFYFRMHREYDRTGTFMLGKEKDLWDKKPNLPLEPDTAYVVRLATLTLDDPYDNDENIPNSELSTRLPDPANWRKDLLQLDADKVEARFRTFPSPDRTEERLAFVLGSCRYPGLLWRVKHADQIFGPIREHARPGNTAGDAIRFVMMVGDQIYADKLNRLIPLERADTFAEFQERYHTAFGSRHMRELLRNIPTYMILDDHEIEDNWTADRIGEGSGKRDLFNIAINAYMSYQWCHGPRTYSFSTFTGQPKGNRLNRLYYTTECGGYPFFVLDTRTLRRMQDNPDSLDDNHLLGRPSLDPINEPGQLERVLQWLTQMHEERRNIPKFIISPSVFVPNPIDARTPMSMQSQEKSDSWPAFPVTRQKILAHIAQNNIQNVIFLSGDIHCANLAQVFLSGSPAVGKIKMYSITSSAFYWPFPFADGDPAEFVHDSTQPGQEDSFDVGDGITMHYRAWNFTQEDNFCRLDLDRSRHLLRVRAYGMDGSLLHFGPDNGKPEPLDAELDLEPW
jgi:alkaline phosphatase D